ncbi:LuxR family two component transcriptional regulator [Sulfuritortus calidifontis]|uniref:LuxR family two component transcriptional regulator n=1 Tax=Sulfuritortus calidifontis TaxID=1914471 RepID=A0A4V2UQA1_9PROT|nr:response regulator transcription factor [Sulfuritortus calidifontis]TCS69443.1 LuxR family two component transcriptional regulator [Sulfuritortus calidifontis]
MNPVSVLIIDDHPLLRLGVKQALESQEGFKVAGECADIRCVQTWLESSQHADVALLDRSLPDGDGLSLVPALKQAGMKVIVLTVEDADEEIRAAIDTGVDGYLLKSSDMEQILHAIGIVLQDAGAFPAHVLQKISRGDSSDPLAKLSQREMEIAEYVAQGHSNKVIGAKLNLSDNTVRNHLANIMQKLGFHNRVQVATLVLQHLRRHKRI